MGYDDLKCDILWFTRVFLSIRVWNLFSLLSEKRNFQDLHKAETEEIQWIQLQGL